MLKKQIAAMLFYLRGLLSPRLFVALTGAVFNTLALAQEAAEEDAPVGIDTSLGDVNRALCNNLVDLQGSQFVAIIAVVMFAAGGFMWWAKMRGGFGLMVTGMVGFFFIRNITTIANSFGLVNCTTVISGGG